MMLTNHVHTHSLHFPLSTTNLSCATAGAAPATDFSFSTRNSYPLASPPPQVNLHLTNFLFLFFEV
ncbi:hypothetical protein HanXRQr2_Chr10g0442901 [Helianthus annuus]|uniref:Uncharacterized protein n=1 Tax=Helianthus annuus TaxID=4232 RepID=A0A9K3HYK8_HELAN|nr:hypothetical protein HanXRQr2_Chr10g0442901 [Helianthus annuus]